MGGVVVAHDEKDVRARWRLCGGYFRQRDQDNEVDASHETWWWRRQKLNRHLARREGAR